MVKVLKPKEEFLKPYCPAGHKKWEVGIEGATGRCYLCNLEGSRVANRRRRARERADRPRAQIATQFKEVREYLGLGIREFAEVLAVDDRTVRDWESGRYRASFEVLQRITPRVAGALAMRKVQLRKYHEDKAVKEARERVVAPPRYRSPNRKQVA